MDEKVHFFFLSPPQELKSLQINLENNALKGAYTGTLSLPKRAHFFL